MIHFQPKPFYNPLELGWVRAMAKGLHKPQFQWNFLVMMGCRDMLGVHLTGESRGIKTQSEMKKGSKWPLWWRKTLHRTAISFLTFPSPPFPCSPVLVCSWGWDQTVATPSASFAGQFSSINCLPRPFVLRFKAFFFLWELSGNAFRTAARERVSLLLLHYHHSYGDLCCLSQDLGCSSWAWTIFPNAGNSLWIKGQGLSQESFDCHCSNIFLHVLAGSCQHGWRQPAPPGWLHQAPTQPRVQTSMNPQCRCRNHCAAKSKYTRASLFFLLTHLKASYRKKKKAHY